MTKREQFVKYLLDNNWIIFEADETKKLWDWIEKTLIPNDPLLDENTHERVVSLPIAETLKDVTRLVVINWSKTDLNKNDYGRIIDKWDVQVKLHLQDDGKTLKVFYDSKRSS